MHFLIIDCYFKVFFVEIQLKKENSKSVFWAQEFERPNHYIGLPNDLNTSPTMNCNSTTSFKQRCIKQSLILLLIFMLSLEEK